MDGVECDAVIAPAVSRVERGQRVARVEESPEIGEVVHRRHRAAGRKDRGSSDEIEIGQINGRQDAVGEIGIRHGRPRSGLEQEMAFED